MKMDFTQHRQRVGRAQSEPMRIDHSRKSENGHTYYLHGSSGNCYTVQMNTRPHCSCPDYWKGNICKHIYFCCIFDLGWEPDKFYCSQFVKSTEANDDTCQICFELVETGSSWSCQNCHKPYHEACVKEWFKLNPTCPTCRRKPEFKECDNFSLMCAKHFGPS